MKKLHFRIILSIFSINVLLLLSLCAMSQSAKSKPQISPGRQIAFKRAKSLDNGISISWLEQTWDTDVLDRNGISGKDFELLKKLGFRSVRLPIAFKYFQNKDVPLHQVLEHVDKVLKLCRIHQLKLIIDYHYGNLDEKNYLTETSGIIGLWSVIAKRYLHEPGDLLFYELYNEPPHMDPKVWKDAAYNIAAAVRKIDKGKTLLIGASNFNSIYELSRFERLADENIIYTYHFYEPFFFTHQGAEWVGDQVSTTGVPFPYNGEKFPGINVKAKNTWGETNYNQYKNDGNEQSIKDKLQIVKTWADKYDVPVICGEYGVYNKYADPDSRCRYIKAVRRTLKELNMPGILWDYNSNFSLFNGDPSIANLSDCMKDALGYTAQK